MERAAKPNTKAPVLRCAGSLGDHRSGKRMPLDPEPVDDGTAGSTITKAGPP